MQIHENKNQKFNVKSKFNIEKNKLIKPHATSQV